MSKLRSFASFVAVNADDLLREWQRYGSQPHIDYCPGECGCGHAHSFEAFKRREYDAYLRYHETDHDAAEGF